MFHQGSLATHSPLTVPPAQSVPSQMFHQGSPATQAPLTAPTTQSVPSHMFHQGSPATQAPLTVPPTQYVPSHMFHQCSPATYSPLTVPPAQSVPSQMFHQGSPAAQAPLIVPPPASRVPSPFRARPQPMEGVFMYGLLNYLDGRVSKCYGCCITLKPGGIIPAPPDNLVLTTRLHRAYYKDGQWKTSPQISSVYFHLNPYVSIISIYNVPDAK